MTEFNRYAMMMEALTELKPEIEAARQIKRAPALPPMSEVLNEFGPMPPEALFLGIASDGLPVMLNLYDPVPGPILIAGDSGTGKTALLQSIAVAAGRTHQPEELQFGALTSHSDEWSALEDIPNNVGVFSLLDRSAEDFIHSLASWAHGNKTSRQSVLLLLDDLEIASNLDFDARQNLRWLLLRGPARRVWPIITLNPNRMENILPWLDAFHTRVFGSIQDSQHIQKLDAEKTELESLNPGTQFSLRERDYWIRFWIPSID
ncbi:MAG TPA: NACHT domain-containing protein [Anaerolineales bacterium]|nr:NACHT domain-containing protein [Anaerolineales bacterium]